MIISDNPLHKVDAEYKADDFLQITTFHRSNAQGNDWKTKIIGLSRLTQERLARMIIANNPTLLDNLMWEKEISILVASKTETETERTA